MAILNPYLTFDGNARDAIEFYKDVFGGELERHDLRRHGRRPSTRATPSPADGVMHGQLTTDRGLHADGRPTTRPA